MRFWCPDLWKTTKEVLFCFAYFFPLVSSEQPIKRMNSSGPLTGRLRRWASRSLAAGAGGGGGVRLSLPLGSLCGLPGGGGPEGGVV